MLCVALHNTADDGDDDDGGGGGGGGEAPLPLFKSHFEVCYASADRSLTRISMQRNESKGPAAAHFQDKQKCMIINGNETNFPSF